MKLLREVIAYTAFAVVVGLFSVWPSYEMVGHDEAMISFTFSHAGKRVGECRNLTQEELNKLPPNMRKLSDCPRERHPISVELRSGDKLLYKDVLAPSGIWSDGKANVYRRIVIPAGSHAIFVGMNDSGNGRDFDFQAAATIDVAPGRNVIVRFDEQLQQFSIR